MKHEHSIKRLLVPAALLMAAATGLVSSLGCFDMFRSKQQRQPVPVAAFVPDQWRAVGYVVNKDGTLTYIGGELDAAAQTASQAAVADGVQQDITGQITGGQMGHGDY